jgi:phosphatidylethanolamine-binding protein (PEBP) family uncharacterized protein
MNTGTGSRGRRIARSAATTVTATAATAIGLAGCTGSSSHPAASAGTPTAPATIALTSSAFKDNSSIPTRFTCDATGSAVSPPLQWTGVPQGTGWLALYAYDNTGSVIHWIVVNIKPTITSFPTGQDNGGDEVTPYLPMCPGTGNTDQYQFTIYAEPASYKLPKIGASYAVDPKALAAHALAIGILDGVYSE